MQDESDKDPLDIASPNASGKTALVENIPAAERITGAAPLDRTSVEGAASRSEASALEMVSAGAEAAPEKIAESVDPKNNDPVFEALVKLHKDVHDILDLLALAQDRLANLEVVMDTTAKQVGFLPPQVRMLGGKVDGLINSISEPKYRATLLSLLGVHDLVDQVLRTLPETENGETDLDHRRNYQVLRTQLRQILDANGLSEIAADGAFNPELHRAVQRVPVTNEAKENHVLEVVRPGFRTEQSILRYAEVLVGQYVPDEAVTSEHEEVGDKAETPSNSS